MVASLLASIRFVQFMAAHGAELVQALTSEGLRIASPGFYATGWEALASGDGNWGPVTLCYGNGTGCYLPDKSLDGPRVLVNTGDSVPFYVVKGEGLCVTLYVTYPVPQSRVDGLLRRLVAGGGGGGMTVRNRLKYYGQVVSFVDAGYFGNISRWWEERQLYLIALVPFRVMQEGLMLLWVPIWALLPQSPVGFTTSWLTLVGVLTAFGVYLMKRAERLRRLAEAAESAQA